MIDKILFEFNDHLQVVASLGMLAPDIERVAEVMIACLKSGGRNIWMGNGGSAADSQHLAAELVGRFRRERRGLSSIALTVDSSILTAICNDYGFEVVFERQIEALCRSVDVVVGISTSGNSLNVRLALRRARKLGAFVVGFSGISGGSMKDECDFCIMVPSNNAARIQEAHILIGHVLCNLVEKTLTDEGAGDV